MMEFIALKVGIVWDPGQAPNVHVTNLLPKQKEIACASILIPQCDACAGSGGSRGRRWQGGFMPPALDTHSYSQLMYCPSLTYLLLPGPLLSSLNQDPPILRPLRMPAGVDLTLDGAFNLSLLYQHLAPGGALECLQSEWVWACAWGIPVLQASRERQSV